MKYINDSARSWVNFLLCSSIRYLCMFSRPHLSQSLIKFIQVSIAVTVTYGQTMDILAPSLPLSADVASWLKWHIGDGYQSRVGDTQLCGTREGKAKARKLPHSVLIKEGFFSKKTDLSHPGLVWRGDVGRTFFIRGEDAGHLFYCGCTYPPLKWVNILFGVFKKNSLSQI